MNSRTETLPKFVKEASILDIKKSENYVMSLRNKLDNIIKGVQNKKYPKPQNKITVISIVPRVIKSSIEIGNMILQHEDKVKLHYYLEAMDEILSELEINILANSFSFYNSKLLKHYQMATNIILNETKVKDIINHCILRLTIDSAK